MRQKRVLTWLATLTLAISTTAQTKPAKIESPIVSERDFVWYVEQKEAWKAETQRNPQDEQAWLNYYNAARYMAWYQEGDTTARQVMGEMEQAIPDSYTFNYCAYREATSGSGYGGDPNHYAEEALKRLPSDMQFFDYDQWVCYLAMVGDESRLRPMAKRYFDSGIYSEAVLRYSYNELRGMDTDGIYIGNGDATIIPKWLIQEGMGMHRDKTIVCASFLVVKEYREWLFKRLGIEMPELKEPKGAEDYDEMQVTLIDAIIGKYGSKVYFSPLNMNTNNHWRDHLYNEGLVMKYSAQPYDNMAVKRRNVEERYMMEYLLVSFRPDWTAGQRLSANYAVLLGDLLPYYARHDRKRYEWLTKLLVLGVENTSLDEERKQEILRSLRVDS